MTKLSLYLKEKSLQVNGRFSEMHFVNGHLEQVTGNGGKFLLASCSKMIVGSMLFKQLIENKININEKFREFLGQFNVYFNGDIFDFLGHRTNLIDYLDIYGVNHQKNNQQILEEFLTRREIKNIDIFQYNNTNYLALFAFINNLVDPDQFLASFSEQISMMNSGEFHSIDQNNKNKIILAESNTCFGDGGFIIDIDKYKKRKNSFFSSFISQVNQSFEFFLKGSSKIDINTNYNFGLFTSIRGHKRYFHHSGFYNSNISYFVMDESLSGSLILLNHENVDKEIIESFLFI